MSLEPYNFLWAEQFQREAELIKSALRNQVLDIQHIGSTAIKNILSKPIIDIAVLVLEIQDREITQSILKQLGYAFFPESSSVERMFFRKGDPTEFHLSITEKGKTPYWEKQIAFRDYLNNHMEKAKEYEQLKQKLALEDPTFGQIYSDGKNDFVRKVLKLAGI